MRLRLRPSTNSFSVFWNLETRNKIVWGSSSARDGGGTYIQSVWQPDTQYAHRTIIMDTAPFATVSGTEQSFLDICRGPLDRPQQVSLAAGRVARPVSISP